MAQLLVQQQKPGQEQRQFGSHVKLVFTRGVRPFVHHRLIHAQLNKWRVKVLINCPACSKKISYFDIKNEFRCKSCNKLLSSNFKFSAIVSLTLAGLVSTPIAFGLFPEINLKTYLADGIIGLLLFMWLQKLTLTINQVNSR